MLTLWMVNFPQTKEGNCLFWYGFKIKSARRLYLGS